MLESEPGPLTSLQVTLSKPTQTDISIEGEIAKRFNWSTAHLTAMEDFLQVPQKLSKVVHEAARCYHEDSLSVIAYIKAFCAKAEQHYGVVLAKTQEGVPTLWWGDESTTASILKLAFVTWTRALTECELPTIRRTGKIIIWERNGWWRVVACWLMHFHQHGALDAMTGMSLDLSGSTYSALAPCLLAHRRHHSFFFTTRDGATVGAESSMDQWEDANCAVQSDWVNRFLGSRRECDLATSLLSSRPMASQLLRRMVARGMLEVEENTIVDIKEGDELGPAVLATIAENK